MKTETINVDQNIDPGKEKIEYYHTVILLDKALYNAIQRRISLLKIVPFSSLTRMRLLIEMEAINSRVISRSRFLTMYDERVKKLSKVQEVKKPLKKVE